MKRGELGRVLALSCGLLILAPSAWLVADVHQPGRTEDKEIADLASPANVAQYVRDRFQIPETTKVDAEPVQHSRLPHFYQTVVTVDDGKQKQAINAFISDDAQCFALGSVFALGGASEADIIRCVREAAALPATAKVAVGAFTGTPFKNFLRSTVTVEVGTKAQKGELFITRDRRVGILGLALPFRRDFVEQLIDTKNQPSIGAAQAPVTIVEYADLECPGCAAFQRFLETEFLPKYKSKVRIVFKEFPLSFHEWSTTAAVANECAYQIDAATFFGYRSMIFGNQTTISAANARERLLGLGEQAGLNRTRLSSCLDSEASLGRIEASRKEAQILGISKTPTFFVNGRMVIGPSETTFYKIVDETLATASKQRTTF